MSLLLLTFNTWNFSLWKRCINLTYMTGRRSGGRMAKKSQEFLGLLLEWQSTQVLGPYAAAFSGALAGSRKGRGGWSIWDWDVCSTQNENENVTSSGLTHSAPMLALKTNKQNTLTLPLSYASKASILCFSHCTHYNPCLLHSALLFHRRRMEILPILPIQDSFLKLFLLWIQFQSLSPRKHSLNPLLK